MGVLGKTEGGRLESLRSRANDSQPLVAGSNGLAGARQACGEHRGQSPHRHGQTKWVTEDPRNVDFLYS